MNYKKESIIGDLVADDYRAAGIFKKYKIDFCCQGNRTLEEACQEKNIKTETLLQELESSNKVQTSTTDYKSWPLDLLADYVEKKHHRYVTKQIPVLQEYLEKIKNVHGEEHPELAEIQELFNATAGELSAHMKKEELMVFPLIRIIATGKDSNGKSITEPIQKMMTEHDTEGERFRKIDELSNNYTPPADACNTYSVTFGLLKEFEDDLHLHIHLENNILFPGAIKLEQENSKELNTY